MQACPARHPASHKRCCKRRGPTRVGEWWGRRGAGETQTHDPRQYTTGPWSRGPTRPRAASSQVVTSRLPKGRGHVPLEGQTAQGSASSRPPQAKQRLPKTGRVFSPNTSRRQECLVPVALARRSRGRDSPRPVTGQTPSKRIARPERISKRSAQRPCLGLHRQVAVGP